MAETRLVGNDGSVALPSGHNAVLNRHRSSLRPVISNVTGFEDSTMQHNRAGIPNLTGSASGTPSHDAASTAPGAEAIDATGGGTMTLTFGAGSTWGFTGLISGITIDAFKVGDQTIVFDYTFGDPAADDFAETWDETP